MIRPSAVQRRRVGIIARVPLAFGMLTGKTTRATNLTADDHRSSIRARAGAKATICRGSTSSRTMWTDARQRRLALRPRYGITL